MKSMTMRGCALLLLAATLGACASRASSPEAPQAAAQPYGGADASAASEAKPEPKKEEPPPAAPSPEPESVGVKEDADPVRQLAEAEKLIEQTFARKKSGVQNENGPPAKEEAGDSCSIACRALASMRRSADRVCELAPSASPDAPRCDDAKERVTKAERRVRERCASCASAP